MTLVLASNSASRKAMLDATGVSYATQPAEIDERAVEAGLGDAAAGDVALALAAAKAVAVSKLRPGLLILGSDSLVEVDGRRFDKPASREHAVEHLRFFSGRAMQLHSAAALARDGTVVWQHGEMAMLRFRTLSKHFIDSYLDTEWPAVSACVGVFRIEALGVQLFETIEGSHYTVLGMPLLAVLGALREHGKMAA